MQQLNENTILFLNKKLDIDSIYNSTSTLYNDVFSFFKEFKSIPEYDKYISTFPLYKTSNFNCIDSLRLDNVAFSTMKIYSLSSGSFENIINSLSKETLVTKSETDQYPEDPELLRFTTSLQKCILNNEDVNENILRLHVSKIEYNLNHLYDLLNFNYLPQYDKTLNSLNASEVLSLYYVVLNLFINNSNFYSKLVESVFNSDELTNQVLINKFSDFVTNNYNYNIDNEELSMLITRFIGKKNFNIFTPSNEFVSQLQDFVKKSIMSKLISSFSTYLENIDVKKIFVLRNVGRIQNILAYRIFKNMINTPILDYFNDDYVFDRNKELDFIFSEDYIEKLINNHLTENNLKDFLLPIYLYKNQPYRFLNSIGRFIELYCEYKMKNKIDYMNFYSYRKRTDGKVEDVLSHLNVDSLYDYLNNLDVQSLKDDDLSWVTSYLFSNHLLKDYFNSDIFTNTIIDILKEFYEYLYDNRWIHYDFNWYHDIELIRHFFMSYFLKYTTINDNGNKKNLVFDGLEEIINDFYQDFEFNITPEIINSYLSTLNKNNTMKENVYNFNVNMLYSTVKRRIYFQVLSYFIQ